MFDTPDYAQGYISACWSDDSNSWIIANNDSHDAPYHANDQNNSVFWTGYGNINHIYENGVVDANANKFTATQKANETLTIGANHLKQTSVYPSSQNQSLDADEAKQKNMTKRSQPLSTEEREEKIQYYTDLFYMSHHSYDEYVDDDAYDAIHVTDLYEEDIKSFEDKFAALGALDRFYQIYLDYCEDALAKFNHRLAEENPLLKTKNNGHKIIFTNYLV